MGANNHQISEQSDFKESLIVCQSSQGLELRATVLRLTRHLAVFEIYNPTLVLRVSEVLNEFRLVLRDRTVYSGRAVIQSLISTGLVTVCQVGLEENSWTDVEFTVEMLRNGRLREQFSEFMRDWEKLYRVAPDYKVIIADMQSYFTELRLWLDQIELGIRSSPSEDRVKVEEETADVLAEPIVPCINVLFEKFEAVAKTLQEAQVPAHRSFMRRQLHPLVLSSPFAYRTFQKPLGYAGDYEMVNMILRNRQEGSSLFAKVVNTWFLRQPPAQAHRNRIEYLHSALQAEALAARREGRPLRVLSLGCGPAQEIQRFFAETLLAETARITLIDFSEETLRYARTTIEAARERHFRQATVEYVRKSVQQILKESGRTVSQPDKQYDLVYCAGLFDYLSDQICHRVIDILYDWVAPGGLVICTNVEPSNPLRNGMEHLLDWHLIYRTSAQLRKLVPNRVPNSNVTIKSEEMGVNLFLEMRKFHNA